MASRTTKLDLVILGPSDRLYISEFSDNFRVLDDAVLDDRTVNGHPLSDDITLTLSDVGAREMTTSEIDEIINN